MTELVNCFDWSKHEIISVIGSGGKTSLINYLAKSFSREKVLVSTTTKILLPKKEEYDVLWLNPYCQNEKKMMSSPQRRFDEDENPKRDAGGDKVFYREKVDGATGIVITGDEILMDGIPKLQMPKRAEFIRSFEQFDKVILESDGSKGLLLKGWEDFEPVVLPETTVTIGVIPISAIGKPATKGYIHRLSLWLKLVEEDERALISNDNDCADKGNADKDEEEAPLITKENIVQMIVSENGLWKEARGDKILYFSQVEDEEQLKLAKEIIGLLPKECKEKMTKIIGGTVREGKGTILYQNK